MNLLFLNSIDAKVYGGMEDWTRLIASGLVDRGHHVHVAGRRGSEFLRRLEQAEAGIELLPLDISGDFNPFTIGKVKEMIDKRQIDAIIVNFNKDLRIGGLAAKFSSGPKVIWRLGVDITKDNAIHRLLTPHLYDAILVPSESLKSQIVAAGYIKPEEITVIPIGTPEIEVTTARESIRDSLGVAPNDLLAVTNGRLVEEKGHRYLIGAAAKLVERRPNLRFLFVGEGPLRRDLERQASESLPPGKILFAGMVDNLPDILGACDLMIHPSVAESFGIALVEGMRASLPIVASRVGGIPEVVGDSGCAVLVNPRNVAQLVDTVDQLLNDPARMRQMGEAGHKRWRAELDERRMIDRIEAYFLRVIAGGVRIG